MLLRVGRNAIFCLRNTRFDIRNTSFGLRNTRFSIRNTRFSIRNIDFGTPQSLNPELEPESMFPMQNLVSLGAPETLDLAS